MKNIAIIWWSDWFWKWLANYLSNNFENKINITITARNIEKLKKTAKEINVWYSTDNEKIIKKVDIIVFCVPISIMQKTIKELAPLAKKDSIILDVTSIKDWPTKYLQEYSPKSAIIIPTHPMFWPYVNDISGQIFVLTPDEKTKQKKEYLFLKNFLNQKNAKIIETTPLEHDKMMAVVQGLTHFDMFVLWETIKKLNLDIKKSLDFVSPIYKIMISSVARYLNQNPQLYSDIQIYNKEVLEVHKVFMETTNKFNNYIKNKDEKNFIKTVKETATYFWENTKDWQEYTDKIIYLIWQQIKKINENLNKKVKIQNIYNNEIIEWILSDFIKNDMIIDNKKFNLNTWEIK